MVAAGPHDAAHYLHILAPAPELAKPPTCARCLYSATRSLVWRSPILTVRCCGANRFLNNGYTITTRFPSVGLAAQLKNAIIQSSYRLPGAAPHLLPIDASQPDM